MKIFHVQRDIVIGQSKGCWLFIQVGCNAYIMRQLWGKRREVALIHAEIDTPRQRLRVSVYGPAFACRSKRLLQFGLTRNNQPGNFYRDRWLRKDGHGV